MIVDKIKMFHMAVTDMAKAKEFYVDTLGCNVTNDNGQGDKHWVSLDMPGGGTSFNLTTALENLQPGTMKLYFTTLDIDQAYSELKAKNVTPTSEIIDPAWGNKLFSVADPDGNQVFIVQA
jgi:catechol 2,3-dioxygenase-like lactoylglutathione lyase family enzyme